MDAIWRDAEFVHSGLGHQKPSGKPIQKHQTCNTWLVFAELISVKGTDFCMSLLFCDKIRQNGLPISCRRMVDSWSYL